VEISEIFSTEWAPALTNLDLKKENIKEALSQYINSFKGCT